MTLPTDATLLLYAGLPQPEHNLDERRKQGYKTIFFLSPEEVKLFACPYGDQALVWECDELILTFFQDNFMSLALETAQIADTGDRSTKLAQILMEAGNLIGFDVHSAKVLEQKKEPLRNAMKNWRWVEDGLPLRRLKGMGKKFGHAAILIAAGPSLNGQWAELRRIREDKNLKTSFIVVGRSYRKAVSEGIMPEFIVEAEQFEWDNGIWSFAPMPAQGSILACPITVCPGVFKGWPAEKVVLVDHMTAQLHQMEKDADSIDAGNSIAHIGYNLAAFLGCNPIGLAGVDLGYPDGSKDTHADGTFHDAWPQQILKAEHTPQEPVYAEAYDGSMLQSSQPYVNFGTLFTTLTYKHRKAAPDLKAYSFSAKGLKMRGIDYMPIKEWGKWNTSALPASSSEASVSLAGSASDAGFTSTLQPSISETQP